MVSKGALTGVLIAALAGLFIVGLMIGQVLLSIASILAFIGIVILLFTSMQSWKAGVVGLVILLVLGAVMGLSGGLAISLPTGGAAPSLGLGNLGSMFTDLWLVMTLQKIPGQNETAVPSGVQVGAAKALTITDISPQPSTLLIGNTFTMLFDIKNEGDRAAKLLYWGVWIENKARQNNALIYNSSGDAVTLTSATAKDTQNVGLWMEAAGYTIPKGGVFRKGYTIMAPDCAGTFKVGAAITYNYLVEAMTKEGIALWNTEKYKTAFTQGTLQQEDKTSESTAGPFKITIAPGMIQPIPIQDMYSGADTSFPIIIGLINQEQGAALIEDLNITFTPDILEIDNKTERNCDFFDAADPRYNLGPKGQYKLKELWTGWDRTKIHRWVKNDTVVGAGTTRINQSDMIWSGEVNERAYSCNFKVKPEKIQEIKTSKIFYVSVSMNYDYSLAKESSITVQGPETCSAKQEQKKTALKQVFTLGTPANRSFIMNRILSDLCGCSTYLGSWSNVEPCGEEIIVNIDGCDSNDSKNGRINTTDILNEAKKNYKDFKCATEQDKIHWRFETSGYALGWTMLGPLPQLEYRKGDVGSGYIGDNWVLYPSNKYRIKFSYTQTGWGIDPRIDVSIEQIENDTVECFQKDKSVCDKASTANPICGSLHCDDTANYLSSRVATYSEVQQMADNQLSNWYGGGKSLSEVLMDAPQFQPPYNLTCQPTYCTYDKTAGSTCDQGISCQCSYPYWCDSTTQKCLGVCTVGVPIAEGQKCICAKAASGPAAEPGYQFIKYEADSATKTFVPKMQGQELNREGQCCCKDGSVDFKTGAGTCPSTCLAQGS